jgi:hypothetical protein
MARLARESREIALTRIESGNYWTCLALSSLGEHVREDLYYLIFKWCWVMITWYNCILLIKWWCYGLDIMMKLNVMINKWWWIIMMINDDDYWWWIMKMKHDDELMMRSATLESRCHCRRRQFVYWYVVWPTR